MHTQKNARNAPEILKSVSETDPVPATLTEAEVRTMFQQSQALQEGHFRLASGRHSDQYMQCARVLQYPAFARRLSQALAQRFRPDGIQVVIGPAIGGIVLAHSVAEAFGGQVRSIFAERENGLMTLRRGFWLDPEEKVLVVEDVITTGGSVQEVLELVAREQGIPVGVGVLVDRSGGKVQFSVRKEAVLTMDILTYAEEHCPYCAQGIPLVKPGSRTL